MDRLPTKLGEGGENVVVGVCGKRVMCNPCTTDQADNCRVTYYTRDAVGFSIKKWQLMSSVLRMVKIICLTKIKVQSLFY